MNNSRKKVLNCIGAGKVGKSLCHKLKTHIQIDCIINQSIESADRAKAVIKDERIRTFSIDQLKSASSANFWMLSCSDDQIEEVSIRLSSTDLLRTGDIVFHCSGSLSSSILRENLSKKIGVASIHPLLSFNGSLAIQDSFKSAPVTLEGDNNAVEQIINLLEPLKLKPIKIASSDKSRYHIASVFASNYLISILELSHNLINEIRINDSDKKQLLDPLIRNTMNNYFQSGTVKSLTGPISRGDLTTIKSHLSELETMPSKWLKAYIELGEITVDLAAKQKHAKHENLSEIASLLKNFRF